MKNYLFVLLIFIGSGVLGQTRPNIIFIFADDLGWGDLSCYGNQELETPQIDRLAGQGTLFTQFYVAGSVCSPSRTGIMTGHYPARHRVFGHFAPEPTNERREMPNFLDPEVYTLTDMLKSQGYVTGHFGKWHLGTVTPSEYGVDEFRTDLHSNLPNLGKMPIWQPELRPQITGQIFDEAINFIRRHDQPYYVNVWLSDVHATLNPSEEQMAPLSKSFQARDVDFKGVQQVYYAALLEMDRQVGRFLDQLEQMGEANNTIVIFSSDNGPEDYQITNSAHSGVGKAEPFRGRKRSIYEGGIRVPFLVRWPGQIPAGKINTESVINGVDFIPSFASITEYTDLPDNLDGEDISDIWLGSDRSRVRPLYWEWRYRVYGHPLHHCPRLALRDGDWKLLMNPDLSRVELYNIPADPMEMTNLVHQETTRVERMKEMLLSWFAEIPESPVDPTAGQVVYGWPGK